MRFQPPCAPQPTCARFPHKQPVWLSWTIGVGIQWTSVGKTHSLKLQKLTHICGDMCISYSYDCPELTRLQPFTQSRWAFPKLVTYLQFLKCSKDIRRKEVRVSCMNGWSKHFCKSEDYRMFTIPSSTSHRATFQMTTLLPPYPASRVAWEGAPFFKWSAGH